MTSDPSAASVTRAEKIVEKLFCSCLVSLDRERGIVWIALALDAARREGALAERESCEKYYDSMARDYVRQNTRMIQRETWEAAAKIADHACGIGSSVVFHADKPGDCTSPYHNIARILRARGAALATEVPQ